MRRLALIACLLTVAVTALSAWIRHRQDGLGCEAWPACQASIASQVPVAGPGRGAGASSPPGSSADTPAAIRIARTTHRVAAMIVGLLVASIAVLGGSDFDGRQRAAASLALAATLFLAWLGRHTPGGLPIVTIGNVIGGFVLAASFGWLATAPAAFASQPRTAAPGAGAGLAVTAFVLLCGLAWLGVMIGEHHAMEACRRLLCLPGTAVDLAAFDPWEAVPAGEPAARSAGEALHAAHRLVALAFAIVVATLAARLLREERARAAAATLLALLATQVTLGALTAGGGLALLSATLHNATAALLAVALARIVAGRARVPSRCPEVGGAGH